MENLVTLMIPAVMGILLLRALVMPIRLAWKMGLYVGSGLLCLWLLNLTSGITGLLLPVNAVTVLLAGILGVPGIGLVALLEVL